MSEANVSWDSPRTVGELHKLGIDVAKSTVDKYRVLKHSSGIPRRNICYGIEMLSMAARQRIPEACPKHGY
jgi:hypothetical protein